MEWAGKANHMGGIPRKMVFMAAGGFAKAFASFLNSTIADTLIRLVRSRPPGVPLITVSNHMSTLDDPLLWGFRGFPTSNHKLLVGFSLLKTSASKIVSLSYFFRLGKCIPITRGGGIYQQHMNEALDRLSDGEWVMPEKFLWGRRPLFPLCNKNIRIIVSEPIEFDLLKMRQMAISMSHNLSPPTLGWPTCPNGLNEAAQRCLYTAISEKFWNVMESLRISGKNL